MKRESNVSTPFMEKLREELADLKAKVIKHYDAGRIGLVDTSVTIPDHRFTLWLEFKNIIPGKRWDRTHFDYLTIAKGKKKQTQLNTARELNALYIFWVYKSGFVVLWDPRENEIITTLSSTREMVDFVAGLIRAEIGGLGNHPD